MREVWQYLEGCEGEKGESEREREGEREGEVWRHLEVHVLHCWRVHLRGPEGPPVGVQVRTRYGPGTAWHNTRVTSCDCFGLYGRTVEREIFGAGKTCRYCSRP